MNEKDFQNFCDNIQSLSYLQLTYLHCICGKLIKQYEIKNNKNNED